MEDIPAHSTEYQDAVREFQATLGSHTFTIVKVQRIQNPSEYAKHLSFRDALKRKYGKPVLEKKVFHGTKEDSMVSIAHQGFNRIFAADANGKYMSIIHHNSVGIAYSCSIIVVNQCRHPKPPRGGGGRQVSKQSGCYYG